MGISEVYFKVRTTDLKLWPLEAKKEYVPHRQNVLGILLWLSA